MGQIKSGPMFDPAATASGTASEIRNPWREKFTVFGQGATTAGAGVATLRVDVSNVEGTPDANDWTPLGTITLTLSTTKANDALAVNAPYRHVRVVAVGISGTGGWAQAYLGHDNP